MAQDFTYFRDFRVSRDGKVNSITSRENVRSALENRFSVSRGQIPFIPLYGTLLKNYQNEVLDRELEARLLSEVTEQFNRDPRVQRLRSVTLKSQSDGLIVLEVEIIIVGANTPVNVRVRI